MNTLSPTISAQDFEYQCIHQPESCLFVGEDSLPTTSQSNRTLPIRLSLRAGSIRQKSTNPRNHIFRDLHNEGEKRNEETSLLVTLLALLLSSFSHALTVTIGGGTATTPVFPFAGCITTVTPSRSTQSQINRAGEISKIRFYYVSGSIANNKDWAILMGHTTKTAFSSNSDWVPSASLTSVFSGDVTSMVPSSAGWMEITLTTPFIYNNSDNLVIAVWQPTAGSSNMNWGAFTSGSNTGIFYRNNTTVPPPNNPPSASGRTSDINRIQLEFPEDVAPLAPQLTAPASGAEVYAGMSLSWTLFAGSTPATGYDVYIDGNLVSSNQAASSYKLPAP